MSGLVHPVPERVKVALVMAGALALGVVAGAAYVALDRMERVVDRWAQW